MRIFSHIASVLFVFLFASCSAGIQPSGTLQGEIDLFPDYKEVTVPCNIAPLNMSLQEEGTFRLIIRHGENEIQVPLKKQHFSIPQRAWHKMLESSKGQSIEMAVAKKDGGEWKSYAPFKVHVSEHAIDPYMVYRLLSTRYGRYDRMGIYQRDLSSFTQTPVFENSLTGYNCVNCHTFPAGNPDKMILHLRNAYPATMLIQNGKIKKLNTKTPETIGTFVYPSWHPSEDYIAFSNNMTQQDFFFHSPNVLEVYDRKSDLVVYDLRTDEIISSPLLKGEHGMETYPAFSPDGKSLYFCSAPQVQMPEEYQKAQYSLCRIDFNAEDRTFGDKVDTLYNGPKNDKSVSFAKISPDGKRIAFTLQQFGGFSEWHPDSDLYMLDLASGDIKPLESINSPQADGYHSWSSDSRWLTFTSRRFDGNYTMPYISFVNENGEPQKPFLLPQENPLKFYQDMLDVFNLPELVTSKVNVDARAIALSAINEPGVDLTYAGPTIEEQTDNNTQMNANGSVN